jgi:hypothetical protein
LAPFKILEQGVADLLSKGESSLATSFSRNPYRGLIPIDVPQTKRNYITGAKLKSRQKQQDGAISRAECSPRIARGDYALHVGGFQISWQ